MIRLLQLHLLNILFSQENHLLMGRLSHTMRSTTKTGFAIRRMKVVEVQSMQGKAGEEVRKIQCKKNSM